MAIIDRERFDFVKDTVEAASRGDALSQVVNELMIPEFIQSLDVMELHLLRTCQCKITPTCLPCNIRVFVFGGEKTSTMKPESKIITSSTDIKKPATMKPHFRVIQ